MANWENVGKIQGEKGDKGDKGDRGEQGLKGEKGDKGDSFQDLPVVWNTLTLENGVERYDTAQTPRYCKIGSIVYLTGAVKGITENRTFIATLPVGYRPSQGVPFVQVGSGSDVTPVRWLVETNGKIEMRFLSSSRPHSENNWFPIDVSFVVS